MIDLRQIANNITDKRLKLRMSQGDLAKKTGLHQSYISRVESGSSVPTLLNLFKIAAALGVDVLDLIRPDEVR